MSLLALLIKLGYGPLAAELPSRLVLMELSALRQILAAIEEAE